MTTHFLKLRTGANSTANFKLLSLRSTVNSKEGNWIETKKIAIVYTTEQFIKTKYEGNIQI